VKTMQGLDVPVERQYDASQYDISLRDLLLSLWRRKWIVVLVAVMFVGAAVGFTLTRPPLYEATIMVLIGQEADAVSTNLGAEVGGLQQITVTMTETVPTKPVADGTIQEQGLSMTYDEFLENLQVAQVPATQIIEISYADPDPRRAQQIVNSVGDVFSQRVAEVSPGANGIAATVWERAAVPESPGVRPFPILKIILPLVVALILNTFLGLVVGLMVGVGLALLVELLDNRWRSPEEAEQVSGVPTFGAVPTVKVARDARRV
jgi:capsular polysaccharide biosynthesis protein